MVQGPGVALERTVPVRLGGVPGMPGLGGQAKIGELQGLHHRPLLAELGEVFGTLEEGVQKSQNEDRRAAQKEGEKY